jgi:hypothetical protein
MERCARARARMRSGPCDISHHGLVRLFVPGPAPTWPIRNAPLFGTPCDQPRGRGRNIGCWFGLERNKAHSKPPVPVCLAPLGGQTGLMERCAQVLMRTLSGTLSATARTPDATDRTRGRARNETSHGPTVHTPGIRGVAAGGTTRTGRGGRSRSRGESSHHPPAVRRFRVRGGRSPKRASPTGRRGTLRLCGTPGPRAQATKPPFRLASRHLGPRGGGGEGSRANEPSHQGVTIRTPDPHRGNESTTYLKSAIV